MTPEEMLAELKRVRARIIELEAECLLLRGSLSKPSQSEPASFTWNQPPTTPGNELP